MGRRGYHVFITLLLLSNIYCCTLTERVSFSVAINYTANFMEQSNVWKLPSI